MTYMNYSTYRDYAIKQEKRILEKDREIYKLKQQLGLEPSDEECRQRIKEQEKQNEDPRIPTDDGLSNKAR